MKRMWMVAAAPLALMVLVCCGLWLDIPRSSTILSWLGLASLAGALLTGLCVLFVVLAGWWHGSHSFRRGDILAATALALLDVLIPTTLAALLWMLVRSLENRSLF